MLHRFRTWKSETCSASAPVQHANQRGTVRAHVRVNPPTSGAWRPGTAPVAIEGTDRWDTPFWPLMTMRICCA